MWDMLRLIKEHFRQWCILMFAAGFSLIKCLGQMSLPVLMAETIDAGAIREDYALMMHFAFYMLAVCLTVGITGFLTHMFTAVAGERFALELRNEMFDRLYRFNLSDYEEFGGGTLLTRVTSDANTCSLIPEVFVQTLFEPLLILFAGIVLVRIIAPRLGFLFAAAAVIQIFIVAVFIYMSMPLFLQIRKKTDSLNRYIQTLFLRISLIKIFRKEDDEDADFGIENEDMFQRGYAAQKLICVFHPLVMFIVDMSVAMILINARSNVGTMSVSRLLEAIAYSQQILLSIVISGQMIRFITEAQPSSARIRLLLEHEPEMRDGSEIIEGRIERLEIRDVTFSYPSSTTVLEHMNLTVDQGLFLAVTGRMGCGKSTLAALLIRYYDPDMGAIYINGNNIRNCKMEDLRRHVALVEKNAAILGGTVMENIVFGRDYVSREDALKAAKAAQCADYIEKLPEKYETYVNGRLLSSGEKQRLTIARALSGYPDILLLDEGTSSMDYETENRMFNAIWEMYPRISIVLFTQRTMSAAKADRIVYIEGGKIFADGSDEWLRANCLQYRSLSMTQQGEVI